MVEPVALQDNLGKTTAAEKIAQIEKAQPELAQRDTTLVGRKKAVEHQSKPVPMDKSDEVIIHRDQEQQKKREERKKTQQEESESKGEESSAPEPTGTGPQPAPPVKHLDVRA